MSRYPRTYILSPFAARGMVLLSTLATRLVVRVTTGCSLEALVAARLQFGGTGCGWLQHGSAGCSSVAAWKRRLQLGCNLATLVAARLQLGCSLVAAGCNSKVLVAAGYSSVALVIARLRLGYRWFQLGGAACGSVSRLVAAWRLGYSLEIAWTHLVTPDNSGVGRIPLQLEKQVST